MSDSGFNEYIASKDEANATEAKRPLTIRSPDEILEMALDDSDNLMGDRLLAKSQPLVMVGQGGLGKSRLLLQMAACQIVGRPFLALETHGGPKRWTVFQTENSNRRLKSDLEAIRNWLSKSEWNRFNANFNIHTLEFEEDVFLSLGDVGNQCRIIDAIKQHQPDVIAWDSAYDIVPGDLNKDVDMRLGLTQLSRISKNENPERSIVLLHHALTGRGGAAKATGFDRASFGRNSKVLHSWARGYINISPGSANDNQTIVLSCGKCSNGREFEPFAAILTREMIYEVDKSFDIPAWKQNLEGKEEPLMKLERVAELCTSAMAKADLAKAITGETGCCRQTAYKWIKRAANKKTIKINKEGACFPG